MACGSSQENVCEQLFNQNICIYTPNSRFLYRLIYTLDKYCSFMLCMIYNLHCFGSFSGPLSVLCVLLRAPVLLQLWFFHLWKFQCRPMFICDLLRRLLWNALLLSCRNRCCLCHAVRDFARKYQIGVCAVLIM